MTGRHRWTKAGLRRDNTRLEQQPRDERTKAARADRQHQIDRQEIARLQAANRAWAARWANAHPTHVPAPRDLRADDDRPTIPHGTDVSSIRAIHRVMPITERPDAANPANIPAA